MEKSKLRSPSYPAIDLKKAIDLVDMIVKSYHKSGVDRDSIAKSMGYSGLTGSSGPVIGALVHYGLLEYVKKNEAKATDLAFSILFAPSEDEKDKAVNDSALRPQIFKKLFEKFGPSAPPAEGIFNFLRPLNFSEGAAKSVAKTYLQTIRFAGLNSLNERPQTEGEDEKDVSVSNTNLKHTPNLRPRAFEFNEQIRFLVDGIDVRILTNSKQSLQTKHLKGMILMLQTQLRCMTIDAEEGIDDARTGEL